MSDMLTVFRLPRWAWNLASLKNSTIWSSTCFCIAIIASFEKMYLSSETSRVTRLKDDDGIERSFLALERSSAMNFFCCFKESSLWFCSLFEFFLTIFEESRFFTTFFFCTDLLKNKAVSRYELDSCMYFNYNRQDYISTG